MMSWLAVGLTVVSPPETPQCCLGHIPLAVGRVCLPVLRLQWSAEERSCQGRET